MAIYAIGDVQGCCDELAMLLDRIGFDPAADEAWFVGDLVNRGPKSAEVLELISALGDAAIVVLGNHDLHLLALAAGRVPGEADRDLMALLEHPRAPQIIDWLRHRPLAHYRPDLNTLMVHAGVSPEWNPLQTVKLAREVEQMLRGRDGDDFLLSMYGERPERWSSALRGHDRLRYVVNCLTRIRYCHPDGRLNFSDKGPPGSQTQGLVPWFELPDRAATAVRIVFGHWASLGFVQQNNVIGIDTGCVWGRELTAVSLDGPMQRVSVPARKR